MKAGIKVGDVMTTNVITTTPDTTLEEAAKIMRDKGIGSIIVAKGNKCEGIVTQTDFVRTAIASNMPNDTPITEIMTHDHDMVSTSVTTDLFDAIAQMRDHGIKHLPVLSNKTLAGIVSMKDVLELEPQLFDLLEEKINTHPQSSSNK